MTVQAPPVFLDRDGTLIVEKEYLSDPQLVCLERGVAEGLSMLQERGHPLIVLSNQSGIGRGKYTEADAQRVNAELTIRLEQARIKILAWYLCPHAPDVVCGCRKPLPGMALAASRDWGVALSGSYVVGDKRSDLELADAIGGMGILVTTGHGLSDVEWAQAQKRPTFCDLRAAAAFIDECESNKNQRRELRRS